MTDDTPPALRPVISPAQELTVDFASGIEASSVAALTKLDGAE
jgi:hypothetical protein